ncbi:MAG: oligosaccharide flippase family protein [Bacteroidetes bacterium]|nr:oligosaccharide flippase family protein [Bacteroidota bacterium]
MHNRFQIIKNVIYYSSSAYVSQVIGLISSIIVARLLGPEDFGIWNAAMLVMGYATYTELGVLSAMGRDLPLYLGQGDLKKAAAVDGSARYITIFGAILAATILLTFSLFGDHSSKMSIGLQAMSLVLILQQIYTYHRIYLRSHNRIKELSQQQFLFSIAAAILALIFVFFGGLIGRLFAAILAHLVILIYAIRRDPWKATPRFDIGVTWSLMRVGIPIIIAGFIITMLTTVDRLMILGFLGERQLGYVGLGIMLVSVVSIVPAMAIQVLVTQINFLYGNTGKNVESLRSYVLNPSAVLSLILPLVIGPIFMLLPFVVHSFLPEYAPGITAAKIVILGTFFYGILGMTDTFLVTLGKLRQYTFIGFSVLFFNIILDYVFIKMGFGIEGIAFGGTLLTYFLYSTIVIGYALSHYTRVPKAWVIFFGRLWSPFLYMVINLWIISYTVDYFSSSESHIDSLLTVCIKLILYLIFCFPLIYFACKELKIDLSMLIIGKMRR